MSGRTSVRLLAVVGIAIAIGLAAAVSPFASSSPDGLVRVAEDQGFANEADTPQIQEDAPVSGYAFPGVENERLAKGLAGFTGVLAVFAIGSGLAWVIRRRSRNRSSRSGPASTSS